MKKIHGMVILAGIFCLTQPGWAADSKAKAKPGATTTPASETSAPAEEASSPSQQPASPSSSETGSGYGKTRGLLGPVTLGPMFNILSVPGAALEGKYGDLLGFGVKFTFIPTITFSGANLSYYTIDARARWFPFRGSFFLGAALGNQTIGAGTSSTITSTGASIDTSVDLKVSTLYLTPHLGWRWVWDSGFMMGMDFGWQLALSSSSTFSLSLSDKTAEAAIKASDDYKALEKTVTDVGDKIGKAGLPSATLLSIGYLF